MLDGGDGKNFNRQLTHPEFDTASFDAKIDDKRSWRIVHTFTKEERDVHKAEIRM